MKNDEWLPRARLRGAVPCVVALSILACTADPIGAPRDMGASTARAAKAPPTTGVTVTSASPAYGDQGTTIDVHVFGSGFASGAQATWLLHGAADPNHVKTNSTTIVSSSELVANVTIASDAQLAFWDVQVALAGGKNGVGSEAFEVTAAQILGPGTTGGDATVMQMNDLLQVVGYSTVSGNTQSAWVYDQTSGMVSLGGGAANGIDPLGTFVVGTGPQSLPTIWNRQSGNTWVPQTLPQPSGSLGATAYGATRLTDGTPLVVGWNTIANQKRSAVASTQAIAWRRGADGVWGTPQSYVTPPGFTAADARDATPHAVVIGHLDGGTAGIVWENPTTYTVLDGKAARINPAGTLIVGENTNRAAVYWWRDPATNKWRVPGTVLPTLGGSGCSEGFGLDVNDAGVVVGWSCNNGTINPTLWQLDLSGPSPVVVGTPTRLPGLGVMTTDDLNTARAVTNAAPYVVAGAAHINQKQRVAVQWNVR